MGTIKKEPALPVLTGVPALLTISQTAEVLHLSRPTIYKFLGAGLLQSSKLVPGCRTSRRLVLRQSVRELVGAGLGK